MVAQHTIQLIERDIYKYLNNLDLYGFDIGDEDQESYLCVYIEDIEEYYDFNDTISDLIYKIESIVKKYNVDLQYDCNGISQATGMFHNGYPILNTFIDCWFS